MRGDVDIFTQDEWNRLYALTHPDFGCITTYGRKMLDTRIRNVQRVALEEQRGELLELYLKAHRDEIELNENDEYQEALAEIDLDLLYALLDYDLLLEGFAEVAAPDYNEGRM